uniref:Gustatory receptor n=1 Tax=Strigamia maritima TaxID=126957 RepID=T1JIH9_STRMM
MAETAYTVLRKLKLLWYYVFLTYGITISTENRHRTCPRTKAGIFIFFFTTKTISFVCSLGIMIYSYSVLTSSATGISVIGSALLLHISTLTSSIIVYKRQVHISAFLQQLMIGLRKSTNLSAIRNRLILYFTLLTTYSLVSIVLFVIEFCYYSNDESYFFYSTKKNSTSFKFYDDLKNYDYLKALVILQSVHWHLVSQMYSGFSIIFFVYVCQLMSKNFKTLKCSIEKSLNSNMPMNNTYLNKVCQKYEKLCRLTSGLSVLFSPLLLVWSAGGLIIICLAVHILKKAFERTSHLQFWMYLLFTCKELVFVCMLYSNAKAIHEEASATAVLISKLRVKENRHNDHRAKISQILFLAQLQKEINGVNVSGIYTITNSSMLTMLGTLLTYAIILYQTE